MSDLDTEKVSATDTDSVPVKVSEKKDKPLPKHDTFLADAIKPHDKHRVSYLDGFRFGFGFFIAGLLITVILGGLSWALVAALRLH